MDAKRVAIGLVLSAFGLMPAESSAQILGTFRWQFSPFCNVVTLSVEQRGQIFVLSGFDNRCGAGVASSATGTAFFNPNGTVGIGLTIIAPSGAAVPNTIQISLSTLSGAWSSANGDSGAFVFEPPASRQGCPVPP